MAGKKKKKAARPVFDSIRKPTAPPNRKFGEAKSDDKANPARRGVKHKKPENPDD